MKKAIMEVADFDKITKFITSRSINAMEAERMVEILNILKRVQLAEVEEPKEKRDAK
jgi:hypothetical protein